MWPLQRDPAPLASEPAGRLPDGVAPLRYRLTLDVDPAQGSFRGEVEIEGERAGREAEAVLHLHAFG